MRWGGGEGVKATRMTVEAEGERLHLPRSALPAQAQPPSLRLSPLRLVPAPPAGLIPDRPRLDRAGPRPLIVGSPSQRAPPSPRDPSPSKAATPQGPFQGRDQPHLSPNLHAWAQQLWMGRERGSAGGLGLGSGVPRKPLHRGGLRLPTFSSVPRSPSLQWMEV